MIKLIATGIPDSVEMYQAALDCATAMGKVIGTHTTTTVPPEGFVMVPIVPTNKIKEAMNAAVRDGWLDSEVWRAALGAL